MINSKHTQGPWMYKRDGFKITIGNHKTVENVKCNHDYTVCQIDDNSWMAEQNAKLIAAAPELLEALIHAKGLIAAYSGGSCDFAIITNAIKKATE